MGNTVNKETVVTNDNVIRVKTVIPQKKYNILILGLNGSGKTTLLYHNFIPEWTNITSYMEPTIAYHYEEIKWINGRLGFWDLSGNPLMRNIWPLIYRNVKVNAILYIINIMDISDECISENNSLISLLLNDECLQMSCIVLVFNTFNEVHKIQEDVKNDMLMKYKIEDLINHYGNRIHYLFVDCKNCKMDKGWIELMHQISYYF
ncbi:putative ADP-ribosylation factor [Plasmodium gaboni]|uniref:ADP-ribosylation factor, putative n=1 Tax=Plasmodium gaboni TaxID=647221 RepID=A0A151LEJ2_9APIC|nr:putative ADP-ribosylation factor [Plasmodium gaboni]KYN97361.1 putative ADP-ribosylation factor [Plasmodium gaboni]SOV18166.1 ADP-ribosylation factor, putative [Plasmodium gaboni]SOV24631.1 ADP-ribosylation factor, putative [Plasmodium sp. DRC-Itaito]